VATPCVTSVSGPGLGLALRPLHRSHAWPGQANHVAIFLPTSCRPTTTATTQGNSEPQSLRVSRLCSEGRIHEYGRHYCLARRRRLQQSSNRDYPGRPPRSPFQNSHIQRNELLQSKLATPPVVSDIQVTKRGKCKRLLNAKAVCECPQQVRDNRTADQRCHHESRTFARHRAEPADAQSEDIRKHDGVAQAAQNNRPDSERPSNWSLLESAIICLRTSGSLGA
jgi:hypothetical protein